MQNHKIFLDLIENEVSKDVFKLLVTSEFEERMDSILDVLSIAVKEKGMCAIYISYTRPSSYLNKKFEEKGIENVYFIDCLTTLVNTEVMSFYREVYIQNPTAFEEVVAGINRIFEFLQEKYRLFIIFDSITTASIFLSEKDVQKLLQAVSAACSAKKCGCIILSTKPEEEDSIEIFAQNCGFTAVKY